VRTACTFERPLAGMSSTEAAVAAAAAAAVRAGQDSAALHRQYHVEMQVISLLILAFEERPPLREVGSRGLGSLFCCTFSLFVLLDRTDP
jgi:hypothetical protein